MICVHTLGTALIDVGSCTIEPTSPRKFALLLYLAAERGRRIPRSVLQELIFPDQADRNSRHSLRELVYQLRQMGAALDTSPDGIEATRSQVSFDYDSLLESQTLAADHIRAATCGFLPGFAPAHSYAFVEWLDAFRARSISALSRTLLREVERARDCGDWDRTERAARACLALDPLNEAATFALAQMLFLGGAKAKATRLLDDYADEVGTVRTDLKTSARALRRRIEQAQESGVSRSSPRFVGRADEMKALRAALGHASRGTAQCVAVSGEPGIGKSRLLSEFRSIVELEGVRCEGVTMQPHDVTRPMGAFVDLVPRLLRLPGALGCAPQSMEDLRRLTHSQAGGLAVQRDKLELDAIAYAVTTAICDLCDSIAGEAPLALIIDDGHALDQFSMNVLSALMSPRRSGRTLLLIGTREPRSILRSLRHTVGVTSLPLRPLPIEATGSLIDDILSPAAPPPAMARHRLLEVANGNPLFALMLASEYRDTHDCSDAPATLMELLGRRLDPLPAADLCVLATCIALGKHCTTDRLLRALEVTPMVLLECIEALSDLGLLDAHSDATYAAHPLIAELVSSRLLPATKRVVNFRVAQIFEADARLRGSPALWWEAANRWQDASDAERALSAFRECATHAMDIGTVSDAARILGEALMLPTCDESKVEAAKELITAADLSSDTSLVLRGYSVLRGCGLSERHDEFELAARRAVIRDSQLPDRFFEATLECLRAESATPEHRVLAATLGLKGVFVADGASRVAHSIESQLSAEDLRHVEDVVRLEFELLLCSTIDDWDNVAKTAERLLRAAESKRPAQRGNIQQNCGIAFSIAGKPQAAIDAWQKAFESGGLARSHSQQVRVATLISGLYADMFDDDNRDVWMSRAVEADSRSVGLFDNFDLPVIQLGRSFAVADLADAGRRLADAARLGMFSGSPTRARWGEAFNLLWRSNQEIPTEADEQAALRIAAKQLGTISGVRDLEIAAAARILWKRDRNAALSVLRNYLDGERRGRQELDRQLTETVRTLGLGETLMTNTPPYKNGHLVDPTRGATVGSKTGRQL